MYHPTYDNHRIVFTRDRKRSRADVPKHASWVERHTDVLATAGSIYSFSKAADGIRVSVEGHSVYLSRDVVDRLHKELGLS